MDELSLCQNMANMTIPMTGFVVIFVFFIIKQIVNQHGFLGL
jgi:hypothetical protein